MAQDGGKVVSLLNWIIKFVKSAYYLQALMSQQPSNAVSILKYLLVISDIYEISSSTCSPTLV